MLPERRSVLVSRIVREADVASAGTDAIVSGGQGCPWHEMSGKGSWLARKDSNLQSPDPEVAGRFRVLLAIPERGRGLISVNTRPSKVIGPRTGQVIDSATWPKSYLPGNGPRRLSRHQPRIGTGQAYPAVVQRVQARTVDRGRLGGSSHGAGCLNGTDWLKSRTLLAPQILWSVRQAGRSLTRRRHRSIACQLSR